jgi:hypothetical protein
VESLQFIIHIMLINSCQGVDDAAISVKKFLSVLTETDRLKRRPA